MNEGKWSSATLRVISESRSVRDITQLLNTEPSRSVEKGTRLSWSNPNSALSMEFRWLLDSGLPDSEPLNAHIMKLASYVETNMATLNSLRSDCEIDLWCAFASGNEQGGFILDATLLKKLTVIPINLVIDLYPPEDKSATMQ